MSTLTAVRSRILVLVLLSGCGGKVSGAALVVTVLAPEGVLADCIEVSAFSAAGKEVDSARFPRAGKTELHVAVFPGGDLESTEVSVEARGFTGAACDRLSARSERKSVMFAPGIARVTVTLGAFAASTDGGSPDAGAADGGALDAGNDAGEVDGGLGDAGPLDAGVRDAGSPDAGAGDAGPPDAGLDAGVIDAGVVDAGACGPPKDAGAACGIGGVCVFDNSCAPTFPYPPSNFDPRALTIISAVADLNCDTTFDSMQLTFSSNFCGQPRPAPVVLTQAGGIEVVVLPMAGLTLRASKTLTLVGGRPVIFAVFGDALLAGTILAQAGADQADCAGSHGTVGNPDGTAGAGGAGAGFGDFGADGGAGANPGGVGGAPHGNAALVPLTGGCSGAAGGAGSGVGGAGAAGGGAVQFSVAGLLYVNGRVGARGLGGRRGATNINGGGGGGGAGSGGAILLEAQTLRVFAALLTANGGGGGEGGGTSNTGIDGFPGNLDTAVPAFGGNANPPNYPGFGGNGGAGVIAATNGLDQNNGLGGGGGGGAGVGRIRLNGLGACQRDGGVISPPATGCP